MGRRSTTTPKRCGICGNHVPAPPETTPSDPTEAANARAYPFCSQRCRAIDLGRWLSEAYRIAGPPVEPEDEAAAGLGLRHQEDPDA